MARVIAIANQKGGVGKTTTTLNLGAGLAEIDKRVLLVDMDPQGNLSISFGIDPGSLEKTIYQVLLDPNEPLADAILKTSIAGLGLVPSNRELAAAKIELNGKTQALTEKLRPVLRHYDYILIDSPPSLDLLTLNALVASQEVLIPMQCHYLALKGLSELYSTISKVKQKLNPDLSVAYILPTFFNARTIHSKEVLEETKEYLDDKVFDSPIKQTIKFADATIAGEPILTFDKNHDASEAYRKLARKVVENEQKTIS